MMRLYDAAIDLARPFDFLTLEYCSEFFYSIFVIISTSIDIAGREWSSYSWENSCLFLQAGKSTFQQDMSLIKFSNSSDFFGRLL